jgi:hypothetical protein
VTIAFYSWALVNRSFAQLHSAITGLERHWTNHSQLLDKIIDRWCSSYFALRCRQAGLVPDGIFEYQKYQIWYTFEGLGMVNFGILKIAIWYIFSPLVYLVVVWCILRSFGIYIFQFSMLYRKKIWQPCFNQWLFVRVRHDYKMFIVKSSFLGTNNCI